MSAELPRTLLIIEEENPLRAELVSTLQKKRFSVLTSSNQQEALAIMQVRKVDLVMVAGVLPHHETFNLVMEVRRPKERKNIPVVLMSSFYFSPGFAEMASRFKNTKYLVRPSPLQDLLTAIEEAYCELDQPKREP